MGPSGLVLPICHFSSLRLVCQTQRKAGSVNCVRKDLGLVRPVCVEA